MCSGQVTRTIWLKEHPAPQDIREMLSGLIKFFPPVRRGNDLLEQVDIPAGHVHAQANMHDAQLSDGVIK